jgi:KDO2-lipid IV(A) lauroyltransferase
MSSGNGVKPLQKVSGSQKVIDYLAYLLLRWVFVAVQILPIERCDRYSRLLAKLLAHYIPIRRKLIDDNLKLVFPQWTPQQIDRTREATWHHLLLMACEIAQAPRKIHRTNWRNHFKINGAGYMVGHMIADRPTILVTGHFGNFELAGFITGVFGLPTSTIVRPLDNPHIHQYIDNFRSLNGQYMIDKQGSSNEVQDVLDQGGVITLLADQYAGPKGCWANFLGHPASCHKALALFTLTSQAPMVVTYNRRMARPLTFEMGHVGTADPQIPGDHLAGVKALTQWYNDQLAIPIYRWPDQYWWLHRRWRGDPPARRRRDE